MAIGLLGRKVGMTQIYDDTGKALPVTVIQAGPCHVLQLRTVQRDGYEAMQLGYLDKPRRLASRSERGHVTPKLDSKRSKKRAEMAQQQAAAAKKRGAEPPEASAVPKAGCEPKRFVREFRGSTDGCKVGQELSVDIFNDVKCVDVVGTSRGRGTAGVMKRHNFHGQRASHGVKKVHRHAGGTGCASYPSRLFKGKRMAGRYGNARCTMRNLKVVKVDADNNLLLVLGAVPGPNGGYVTIRETNKLG